MTAISAFLDFEKSKMMSSAIFLALPYGLIGNCTRQFQLKIFFFCLSLKCLSLFHYKEFEIAEAAADLGSFFSDGHLLRLSVGSARAGVDQSFHTVCCHSFQHH
jgi:hypothetical protein